MKQMLMMLLALTVAPVWAEEAAAPVAQAAASAAQTAVTVVLSGSSKGVRALLAELEKDAVYKDSGCSGKPMKKSAKTAKISCANASSALLDYLGKHTPAKVRWSISGSAPKMLASINCNINCLPMTCGGITVCAKKKPYPLCSAPCP